MFETTNQLIVSGFGLTIAMTIETVITGSIAISDVSRH
jgi:hypothetical protein